MTYTIQTSCLLTVTSHPDLDSELLLTMGNLVKGLLDWQMVGK